MSEIKVIAYGLAALFGLGGITLLGLGYQGNNGQEIGGGWTLIVLAFVMWLLSFADKASRGRRWHFK